jgi:uncharacterized protein YkwD
MILTDLVIILVLVIYAVIGYRRGFVSHVSELLGFILGFVIAFLLSHPIGGVLIEVINLPRSFADLAAFLAVWLAVELVFAMGSKRVLKRVPQEIQDSPANRIAGLAPALVKGLMLVMIAVLIVAASPLPTAAKNPIVGSGLGKILVAAGTGVQQQFNNLFGSALKDTLAFKTIKTDSEDSVSLGFTDANPKLCENDERKMLELLNKERTDRGLGALSADEQLRGVGRAHSKDMLARGYFAHVNPDGLDPFERMDRAGVDYMYAGENLAFAPTVEIAHSGLMNSPGHKANILKPEYTKVGIGCMDAGYRGLMFSQEFKG